MHTGERLKQVRKEKKLSQGQLAKICGLAQSTIADLERNRNTGSSKIAVIAKALDVSALWLSEGKGAKQNANNQINQELVEYSNTVQIKLLAATASMGNGTEIEGSEVVVDVLRLKKDWVDKNIHPTNIKNLSFIHAIGSSMSPTLNDGDILLVDSGIKTITSDCIYVLEAHNRLFVKSVRQTLNGQYEIYSDNPSVKTVDILNGDHEVTVLGRVVWVWNGRKV
jgi:phage repressor protein C with HTH and peptisase S24 domain